MGISKTDQGLGSLQAYKKDQVSWDDVIKEARLFNYSPKQVSKVLNQMFLSEFYGNTPFLTFALCTVYHNRLPKDETPYETQTYIMRHYPLLVGPTCKDLLKQLKAAKGHKKKTISEKLRSLRNTIPNKYKRIKEHKSWDRFISKYSKAASIQKILKKYYVR
jgi:hypothetical protein